MEKNHLRMEFKDKNPWRKILIRMEFKEKILGKNPRKDEI